jgi:CDP-glycerol glycerophosphotransferase (TagB/SpsB family)
VGRPQTEISLERSDRKDNDIKKILYAPTWEGIVDDADYSSVRIEGLEMLRNIAEKGEYDIRIKFHPLTGSKKEHTRLALGEMQDLAKKYGIEVYPRETPISELMNWSDAMICDISSVLNEYLYTNKPIVLAALNAKLSGNLHENFPSSKASYILYESEQTENVLNMMAQDDPELTKKREEILQYSLSISKGSSLMRFDQALSDPA